MKRILVWLLSVAMVMGFAVVPASAAGAQTVSGETKEVNMADGSFTYNVSIENNAGNAVAAVKVTWPETELELTGVTFGTIMPDAATPAATNSGSFKVSLGDDMATANYEGDGVLFTMNFNILDAATAGAKTIGLDFGTAADDFMDINMDTVETTFVPGTVTLVDGETPAPAEETAKVTIDPASYTFAKDEAAKEIKITTDVTSGAAIVYQLNSEEEVVTSGSAISFSLYTSGGAIFTTPGGINLGSSVVLKAWALVNGVKGDVAEGKYDVKSESSGGGGGGGGGSATPAKQFPYTDVAENDYFRKPVEWALKKGVLSAEYPSKFNPTMGATRSDMVYYLWLAKGSPAPTTTEMPFTDVAASADYYNAVLWAYENGITAGVSATEFAPNQTVTRAQAITFLYGVAGRPAAGSEPFDDVNAEDYFAAPVAWAYGKGITAGTSANLFSPDRGCQRAQIITFMALYFAD